VDKNKEQQNTLMMTDGNNDHRDSANYDND
jgi:hypothetical protein